MNQQLLFFFSALGAFNGLLVGLYFLFFSKPKHVSNAWLGALFLALSVRVGKSVFFYFYDNLADAYIEFGLFACWLIGPFLFYYVRTSLGTKTWLDKNAIPIVGSLAGIGILVSLSFSWSANPLLWEFIVRIIYTQWLLIALLSGWTLFQYRKQWFTQAKNKPFRLWLTSIFCGNLIICLAFNTGNYTSYIVGALSFSFVFYALILLLLFFKRRDALLFLKPKKYQNNVLPQAEAEAIHTRLIHTIEKEELFLDADLTVNQVARKLGVSSAKVSQTLNEYCNSNFNALINTYRITAAKEMILKEAGYTLEAIAMDCGFNSKSTFYTAFKKQTGMTPKQFRDRIS